MHFHTPNTVVEQRTFAPGMALDHVAVRNDLYAGEISVGDDPPWRVLYLGPDRAANMLEVVVIERDDGSELAIHATKMRGRYQRLLPGRNRNDE